MLRLFGMFCVFVTIYRAVIARIDILQGDET